MASPSIAWQVFVDWDNNGDFTGPYDDITNRVDLGRGITLNRGRDPSRSLGEPRIPSMQLTCLNDDRFFSNEFPGSPIYQKATTGHPVLLLTAGGADVSLNATTSLDDATTYVSGTYSLALFTGYLDDFTHQPSYADRRVVMRVLGSLIRLKNRQEISTSLYTDITTGAAMSALLDAVGWSATKRRIVNCDLILKYWWLDRQDPYRAAIDLLHTEGPGSSLYEDEDGSIAFEGQTYRQNQSRSTTVQASFMPDGTGIYFTNPEHDNGARDIINIATYTVRTRSLKSASTVWQSSPSLSLVPNEVRTIEVYTSDPVVSPTSPLVAGTDYVVTAGSIASATVAQTAATRLIISLTAGPSGVTLTGLQVRAQAYTVDLEEVMRNVVDTSASQTTHGPNKRDMSGRAEVDRNVAVAVCDVTVQRYMEERAVNRFGVIGYAVAPLSQILSRTVSDRIHYVEFQTAQDIDSFVESKEIQIIPNLVTAVIGCERAQLGAGVGTYGRWDQALFDQGLFGQ